MGSLRTLNISRNCDEIDSECFSAIVTRTVLLEVLTMQVRPPILESFSVCIKLGWYYMWGLMILHCNSTMTRPHTVAGSV